MRQEGKRGNGIEGNKGKETEGKEIYEGNGELRGRNERNERGKGSSLVKVNELDEKEKGTGGKEVKGNQENQKKMVSERKESS